MSRQTFFTVNLQVCRINDFIPNFVMINSEPAWLNFDEGRIVMDGDAVYSTETHLKDHLGNTRVVFSRPSSGLVINQVNSYYPFGMNIKGLASIIANEDPRYFKNEYLYNDNPDSYREFQDELGLDWLDYGARMYDAKLGRWHAADPMAEEYQSWTPYHYVHNNPISLIDPTGMFATNYEDENENIIAKTNDGSDDVVTITNDKLAGFRSSWEGTSEEARNSQEMNNSWKEYSGNNIKSDKLDPSTIGRNYFHSNYIGPHNPPTYANARGIRKWDYTTPPVNMADASAMIHDKRYDKLGIAGPTGVVFDTRAIGADWRFVGSQLIAAGLSTIKGDYMTAANAYTSGFFIGLGAIGKTLIQSSSTNGAIEIIMYDQISK